MRIPQPPEQIKEAPAQALRAVFAGIGQVLLMAERVTRRLAAPAAGPAVPEAGTAGPAGATADPASGGKTPDG